MINLETPYFSVILGADEFKRQAPAQPACAALLIDHYPLADDEAATGFIMCKPGEANVDEGLRTSLCDMPLTAEPLGLRFTLVRWCDGTESVVGFSIDDTLPSPALLKWAYRNGYAARRLKVLLAKRAEERRNG